MTSQQTLFASTKVDLKDKLKLETSQLLCKAACLVLYGDHKCTLHTILR